MSVVGGPQIFSKSRHNEGSALEIPRALASSVVRLPAEYGIPDFSPLQRAQGLHDPIRIDPDNVSQQSVSAIASAYRQFGFALIWTPPPHGPLGPSQMREVGRNLGLGPIYTPPYFSSGKHSASIASPGVALIKSGDSQGIAQHATFQTGREEPLHVDGTVAPIGVVKTSFLYCYSKAALGGETLLFNATGAFFDLYRSEPKIMEPLFDQKALRRGMRGANEHQIGPVFAFQGEKLVTSFSVNATAEWNIGERGVRGLEVALNRLMQCATPGSPYLLQFPLETGMGIIMANDVIAHGRTAFYDSPAGVRCMFRTLHTAQPL